ncbi:MAG: hypothetical protein K0U84_02500 [Actinomycetia bacterium]|nr:hypothetical protein [Actinomycetes bacterium]
MTESPESPAQSAGDTPQPRTTEPLLSHEKYDGRHSRLLQVAAWVGIVAGVLFIVAVIFFAGLLTGRSTGGYYDWHRGYHSGQMAPGKAPHCGMMGSGGMMGPDGGMMGPDGGMMGPDGQMGPGRMGPGEPSPTSPTPSPSPRP